MEKKEAIQILAKDPPVGKHQASGEVESGVKSASIQTMTMRLALKARYKSKIRTTQHS